ncbi:MAG TPA: SGNH/GDSL hydrolase family protein [Acidimicrobiia bacterium]|nr:SGNH/GDSL hydrolase family protein [Acidimicrobiia bacterium]
MRALLLLGDSIRLGYQAAVVAALSDWSVSGPEENCRSIRDLAAGLDRWAFDGLAAPTFVHVNAGLHDLRRSEETDWEPLVPPDEYRMHLRAVLGRLSQHPRIGPQRVIVATTTPVDTARHNVAKSSHRHQEDVVTYNGALMAEARRLGVRVNDLGGAVLAARQDPLSADGVHLTDMGYRRLGALVADAVLEAAAMFRS